MIKAGAKLAYTKLRQVAQKKRNRESSTSSSSSTSGSYDSSTHYTSDEDMFVERRKKKRKIDDRTSVSQTQQTDSGQLFESEKDPLQLSDNSLSENE